MSVNLAIFTTQLIADRRWRMPWRTVLEVAGNWQELGHDVVVFSGDGIANEQEISGVRIVYIKRPKISSAIDLFVQVLIEHKIERLYFPIAPGRLNFKLARNLSRNNISLVWYFPGAWYTTGQVLGALKVLPWRSLVSYFIQASFPKRFWIYLLRVNGDLPIITMTPFTAKRLIESGYPKKLVFPICPGKSPVFREVLPISESCQEVVDRVSGKRFFIFFGPPNAIRGIMHILQAFQRVTASNWDSCLVCLFRNDENITNEPKAVRHMIESMNLGHRLITHWDSVNSSELDWFLQNCFTVLKPFVIVPSEIPLAVIETAEYGKPVIGFSGDGTGEFIDKIGVTVERCSCNKLAEAMIELLGLPDYYDERCHAAKQVYDHHPMWSDVANQWLQVYGDKCREGQSHNESS